MPTFNEEKRRRIEQFADYLRLMGLRRHKFTKGDCYIVFDDSPPEDAESRQLKESAIKVDCLADGDSASGSEAASDCPTSDWQGGEAQTRYVQFAFRPDCFYMELPNATLFPQEAEQILRHRPGFYWAKNRPDLRWVRRNWKDMVKWEPLQKVYLYGDEESAAEDMAFILFQVWNFPVDSPLYIKAGVFGSKQFDLSEQID
jgi:hypothetical protein